ncbi:hypothetical protein R4P57_13580 [Rhodococcus sp. IEGM 1330]|nr:hypothetical protein [Rhodococcus sp. IEGM 1330]
MLDNTIVNVVDHPRDRGDFGCGCAGFDHAVVDAVPDTLMNPDQKNFAGETVISVIEIVTSPTLALTDEPAQELVIPPRRSVHAWRTLL